MLAAMSGMGSSMADIVGAAAAVQKVASKVTKQGIVALTAPPNNSCHTLTHRTTTPPT